ncbi:sugar ABC transporter permease [Nocardioides panaciterrulae]|uniref:Arabinogalactan oligomer/maltooligosaccharide transport system permease protein n=1 Tax=Nocardioides panaciterrulae TaxID=661492 RepID=A0A7Y9E9Y7_9ACTN|nr:carbohydrate ABC transporter permease [Nocardioides panaciterrulae]NYD43727.1 arabinogalactan oligomer/maltooligosaccharide transport system permease protein [Nocardioides panaciterrulae]
MSSPRAIEVLPEVAGPGPDRGTGRTKQVRRRSQRSPLASLALHGTLALATFIALFPVAWVLLSSFKPASEIRSSQIQLIADPSLDNYRQVLFHTNFPSWFLNSVIVAAFTMVIGISMSALAGYAMSRFNFPGRRGLMWVFLLTQMFPVAILIVPIYTIMAKLGLIDTKASLVIAYCTVAVPFCAWMLRGYFDTIPKELDEAAALDGLGPFRTFWRVVLPLARPGLAVTAFYTFLTAWGEVAYAIAFMQTDDHYTLGAGLQQFVPQFQPRWELLTAGAVLITIPAGLVFFIAQKHLVAGLTAGGTKG